MGETASGRTFPATWHRGLGFLRWQSRLPALLLPVRHFPPPQAHFLALALAFPHQPRFWSRNPARLSVPPLPSRPVQLRRRDFPVPPPGPVHQTRERPRGLPNPGLAAGRLAQARTLPRSAAPPAVRRLGYCFRLPAHCDPAGRQRHRCPPGVVRGRRPGECGWSRTATSLRAAAARSGCRCGQDLWSWPPRCQHPSPCPPPRQARRR